MIATHRTDRRTRRVASIEPLLLPYQRRWVLDHSRLKLWEKSRQIGADYSEAAWVACSRLSGERAVDYWYSSNDETAARQFMDYVAHFCAALGRFTDIIEADADFDGLTLKVIRIDFPIPPGRTSGPKVTALSSSPKAFRSKSGDVTISEFAFHEQARELYKAALPVTTWGGRLSIMSSHHGETSLFNEFCEMARRRLDPDRYGAPRAHDIPWSMHRTDIHQAVGEGLVERMNERSGTSETREQFLARLRAECGDPAVWSEEYECRPSDQAGSYLPFELLRPCVSHRAARPCDSVAQLLAHAAEITGEKGRCPGAPLYAGVDIGRRIDRFVVWIGAEHAGARRLAGVLVWQGRSFAEMDAALRAVMEFRGSRGACVRRMCIDATGLGMQLAESMRRAYGGRVEEVTLTASLKAELYPLLRRHVEERTIELPDDPATLADLSSVRREVTVAGNVRYAGEKNEHGHADRACAAALMLHAADRPNRDVWTQRLPRGCML